MKKDGIQLIYRLAAIKGDLKMDRSNSKYLTVLQLVAVILAAILFFKNISNSVYDGMTIIAGVIMFTGIINIVKNIIKK
jgi:hypothetical protein